MFSKILISGNIEVITGMHIGTGGEFAAIGAVDSPVVRDTLSAKPIIPGSTLKGKLRAILAKKYSPMANKASDDCEEIKRLFGSAGTTKKQQPSRLIFSDMHIINLDDLKGKGIYNPTEVKFENTINRLSGVANPRQIERTIRGTEFGMDIVYNADKDEDIIPDLTLLAEGMQMLKYDYLGGHGSRGYGKIRFKDVHAELVAGETDDSIIDQINDFLKKINEGGLI